MRENLMISENLLNKKKSQKIINSEKFYKVYKINYYTYSISVLSDILFPPKFNPFRFIDGSGFCKGAKPSKLFGNLVEEFLLVIIEI